MKTIKRTLAVLVTLVLLLTAVPVGMNANVLSIQAAAADNPIKVTLDEVASVYGHGTYFTANRKACNHSSTTTCDNCKLATILDSADCKKIKRCSNSTYNANTWTCFSFASFCFTQCFGKMYTSANYYKAMDSNNLFSGRTDFTNQSVEKKREFFSYGKIGDIIKCYSYDGSYHHKHSMVFLSADSTGVTVFDANVGGDSSHTGKVRKGKIKYENIKHYNIELLRANNYNEIDVKVSFNGNGGTPSASSLTFKVGEIYGVAMPSAIGKDGYSFDGWYSAASGGSRYGRASTVTQTRTTFYAHWAKNNAGVLEPNHVYKIYNKKSGLPLQDNSSGGSVRQMAESGGWNQLWKVTYSDASGYYQFVSMNNGLAMSMGTSDRYAFGTALQMTAPNGGDTQKFSLIKREDKAGTSGLYSIHSKYSGRALDIIDASTAAGAGLQQWEPHLGDNQLFYFVDVTQSLAPTYATISTSKTTYEVNEPVVFYCNSNGAANNNWIWVLYPDGSNPYFENVGTEYQLSFTMPGHYEAQIVAWNDFGHYDGNAISFDVINPYVPLPTAVLTASETCCDNKTEVVFHFSGENTTGVYWLGIYKDDVRIDTVQVTGNEYRRSFPEAGNYSAYMTSNNINGDYADSNWVYWTVYDPASSEQPSDPQPSDPQPSDPQPSDPQPENLCPWCGQVHEGFFQMIIGFFHNILAAILGAKY